MSDIGDSLRRAREEQGLSLDDIAQATRIKPLYLEALEDGEYSLIPGTAYVSGFLRSYARFLRLDADDLVQRYHALNRPVPADVKPATRVLASGHERYNRTRLLYALATVVLFLAGGYAIKQYNDTYAHPYSAPLLTPANLGGPTPAPVHLRHSATQRRAATRVWVGLRATAPVWVRVTADNRRVFQGMLRPGMGLKHWMGQRSVYILTYDGAHLRARYDGASQGPLNTAPGLMVDQATAAGFRRVS